jgi:hypothetical protein
LQSYYSKNSSSSNGYRKTQVRKSASKSNTCWRKSTRHWTCWTARGQAVAINRWRVSMSDPKLKISEAIRRLESQIAVRMSEYRRFMERFSNQGDHTAIERADQVMRIVNRHRNEIAELKKKLDEPE